MEDDIYDIQKRFDSVLRKIKDSEKYTKKVAR
jgi:hypothetical protein